MEEAGRVFLLRFSFICWLYLHSNYKLVLFSFQVGAVFFIVLVRCVLLIALGFVLVIVVVVAILVTGGEVSEVFVVTVVLADLVITLPAAVLALILYCSELYCYDCCCCCCYFFMFLLLVV